MSNSLLPQTAKNLPIDTLRMFKVLTEIKSISGTAQVISRSQPAVSLQLKKLEETLGTTLFRRSKGTFILTRNGKILLHYAEEILELNDRLFNALSNSSKQKTLRIGMPNDFIQKFWPKALLQFNDSHPDISFKVYEDLSINLIKMLHENKLDIALTLLPKGDGKYCTYSLPKNLIWVGNKSLVKSKPLSIITCFDGCTYRECMLVALRKAQIPYKTILTTNIGYLCPMPN